jgi:LuxR family maltose regulon positive regulatory protein
VIEDRRGTWPKTDGLVDRRLLRRIVDDGEHRAALVCVTASAGTGKTSFLREWCRSNPANRVFLDARPSDGRRRAWQEQLDELSARPEVSVVIDGVESLRGHSERERLREAVAAVTRGAIVLSGRTQPIPIAELVPGRPLVTIGPADLSFGVREADELLQSAGVSIAHGTLLDLLDRVGGHAFSLSLAVAVLVRSDDPDAVVRRLVHAPGLPDEQLAAAFLGHLAGADQEALLALAAVPSFGSELAAELTGRRDAGILIRDLELQPRLLRRTAHDDGDDYHFDESFRRALLAEQERRDPARLGRLHGTASRWYIARGDVEAGLDQAVRTGASELIELLLRRHGLGLVFSGSTLAVRQALTALEDRGVLSPTTALLSALLTSPFLMDSVRIDHFLALASEGAAESAERSIVLASMRVMRADTGSATADALRALDRAVRHCEEQPRGEAGPVAVLDARMFAEVCRGTAQLRAGDTDGALSAAMQVAACAEEGGRLWLALLALEVAVDAASARGRWALAKALQRRIAKLADVDALPENIVQASALLRVASAAYQSCEPFRCSRLADIIQAQWRGLDTGGAIVPRALHALFRLDDEVDARVIYEELDRLLAMSMRKHPLTYAIGTFRYLDLTLRLRGRDAAHERSAVLASVVGEDALEVVLADAMLREGRSGQAEAEAALERALRGGALPWHGSNLVFGWLLLASWAAESGRDNAAHERLVEAVALAARMDARRPFLARGGAFARLVEEHLGAFGADEEFARSVVEVLHTLRPGDRSNDDSVRLTAREQSLLRELPLHQSIGRIAEKHSVSVNTVKTHLRSIYAKLEARDRASAVERARRLGLL